MDVYLVPVGRDKHELYCEVPDEPEETTDPAPKRGFFRGLKDKFNAMLAEAERQRRQGHAESAPAGWMGRAKTRMMRWVAESIAEQRLLWHLRRCDEACLFYPDDLPQPQAAAELRAHLQRDFEKHRFWLIIDGLGFLASGLFMLVPGPNLIAYYFAFRLVGHYLSMRGARQGLSHVRWHEENSEALSELRRAIDLEPRSRALRVHELARRLRLEHLASFFERTAVPLS